MLNQHWSLAGDFFRLCWQWVQLIIVLQSDYGLNLTRCLEQRTATGTKNWEGQVAADLFRWNRPLSQADISNLVFISLSLGQPETSPSYPCRASSPWPSVPSRSRWSARTRTWRTRIPCLPASRKRTEIKKKFFLKMFERLQKRKTRRLNE